MEEIASAIEDYLEAAHNSIRAISPRVLNVYVGTKIVNGKDTGEPCITIVVDKKVGASLLSASEIIPKAISNFKTDIVELSPVGWIAGKTSVSELSPKAQRRLLGAFFETPKVMTKSWSGASPVEVNWVAAGKVTPTEDQQQCGSCTGFGCGKTGQDALYVKRGIASKWSKKMIFEGSGGTCNNGNTVEAPLDFMKNTGAALDEDCPYDLGAGVDSQCSLPSDWYTRGYKLDSWSTTTNQATMKMWLSDQPVVTAMNVHQSFMNYVGGVYQSLGMFDPIVGGHCIECVGVSDAGGYWIIQNSWGTGWGESETDGGEIGYCRIRMGDSNIDDQMWSVVVSASPPNPNPNPNPTPSPCKYGRGAAKIASFLPWLLHRKGRFYYLNPPE